MRTDTPQPTAALVPRPSSSKQSTAAPAPAPAASAPAASPQLKKHTLSESVKIARKQLKANQKKAKEELYRKYERRFKREEPQIYNIHEKLEKLEEVLHSRSLLDKDSKIRSDIKALIRFIKENPDKQTSTEVTQKLAKLTKEHETILRELDEQQRVLARTEAELAKKKQERTTAAALERAAARARNRRLFQQAAQYAINESMKRQAEATTSSAGKRTRKKKKRV